MSYLDELWNPSSEQQEKRTQMLHDLDQFFSTPLDKITDRDISNIQQSRVGDMLSQCVTQIEHTDNMQKLFEEQLQQINELEDQNVLQGIEGKFR